MQGPCHNPLACQARYNAPGEGGSRGGYDSGVMVGRDYGHLDYDMGVIPPGMTGKVHDIGVIGQAAPRRRSERGHSQEGGE